jgi:hypothetical protein
MKFSVSWPGTTDHYPRHCDALPYQASSGYLGGNIRSKSLYTRRRQVEQATKACFIRALASFKGRQRLPPAVAPYCGGTLSLGHGTPENNTHFEYVTN